MQSVSRLLEKSALAVKVPVVTEDAVSAVAQSATNALPETNLSYYYNLGIQDARNAANG